MSDNQNLSDRIDVTVSPIEDKDMKLADPSVSAVVNDIYSFAEITTVTKMVFPDNAKDSGFYSLCFGDSDSGGEAGYYLFKDKTKAFLEVDDTDNTGQIYRIRLLTPDENAASQVTITEENGMFKFSVNGNVDEYPLVEFSQKNGDNWDVLTGVDADVQAIVAAVEALFATMLVTDNVLKNVNNLSHGDDVPEYVGTYEGVNVDKLDLESIQSNLDLADYLQEVATDNIVDEAVTEAKIADESITEYKLADDSVTKSAIKDESVRTEKIKDKAVTEAKLADAAVTNRKLASPVVSMNDLDAFTVNATDITMYFKIEKDTKLLKAFNADDDSPLEMTLKGRFSDDKGNIKKQLLYFTMLDDPDSAVDKILITDDGDDKEDMAGLVCELDSSLIDYDDDAIFDVTATEIQLTGEVIYGEDKNWLYTWKGDIEIGSGSSCYKVDDAGNIVQNNRDTGEDACFILRNNGLEGGIEPDKLSEKTLKLIANSGGGSAGGGLKIIDMLIDGLPDEPLEANVMYLIAPDEGSPDNNVLTLPEGEAGDVVVILDADYKFKDTPVVVGSDKKIDGFDTITLDMTHCYLEFIFSERRNSWVTRDPLFAPVSLTHARFKR